MSTTTTLIPGDFPLWTTHSDAEKRLLDGLTALNDERQCDITIDGEVRCALLHNLFISTQVAGLLRRRRLVLRSVTITEPLDLSFTRVGFPLTLDRWTAKAGIRMHHAKLIHLAIRGGTFHGLEANGVTVSGDVDLGGHVVFRGPVSLERSKVRGSVRVRDVTIDNRNGYALNADDGFVGGALDLEESRFRGGVSLRNLHVRGDLRGCRAWFGRGMQVTEPAAGNAANVNHPPASQPSLAFDGALMQVGGSLDLSGARAYGEMSLMNTVCRGNMVFNKARLRTYTGDALSIDHARIGGGVFFRGFTAQGNVRIPGAEVGLDVEFRRATIRGGSAGSAPAPDGTSPSLNPEEEVPALGASRMQLHGSFHLFDFTASGPVSLVGSRIDGSLVCQDATFAAYWPTPAGKPRGRCCLRARGITLRGGVDFIRIQANSLFDFRSIRARDVAMKFIDFADGTVTGILLDDARIQGECALVRIPPKPGSKLVLSHASVGSLRHGAESWPPMMQLDGCTYNAIDFSEPASPGATPAPSQPTPDWSERVQSLLRGIVRLFWGSSPRCESLQWVSRQQSPHFQPQPYEQLTAVLLAGGNDDEAKQIQIGMEEARYGEGGDPAAVTLNRLSGWLLEHGHSTRRLWVLATLWVTVAAILFGQAKGAKVIQASHDEVVVTQPVQPVQKAGPAPAESPEFNAYVYALDAFVPLVDLHQEGYWMPNREMACVSRIGGVRVPACGAMFRMYFWIHILLGWITTTLLVISVTGMIRRAPLE